MCREVPKFQKIYWKLDENTKTAEVKTAYKACPIRNNGKLEENTKRGLSDLKSGEAERCRGSSPRLSAIIITVIQSLLLRGGFFYLELIVFK